MAGKVSGRIKRAITSSLALFAIAAILAASNTWVQQRDRGLATGSSSSAQETFFVQAVDRPDISAFYKRMSRSQKIAAARNLRRYENPKMVDLAAIWLTDFDPDARAELSQTMLHFADRYPKEVAVQLHRTGGFQKLAVFAALNRAGATGLPFVVDQLEDAASRANAAEFLVSKGDSVGPSIVSKLGSKDREVQLVAADILGKVAYRPAASTIRKLYQSATEADRLPYLAALANLGDGVDEPLFSGLAQSDQTPVSVRANAYIGLARIGTSSSLDALESVVRANPVDKAQALEALALAGNAGLENDLPLTDRLEIASGIKSQRADSVIAHGLTRANTRLRAVELAVNRPGVVPGLMRLLEQLPDFGEGRLAALAIRAIASTGEGRRAISDNRTLDRFKGFVQRDTAGPR